MKVAHNRKNYVGQKFGSLKILEDLPTEKTSSGYTSYVLCECDCGITKKIRKAHVVNGNTKSCGCIRSKKAKIAIQKLIPPPSTKESVYKKIYNQYKSDAKRTNKNFEINYEFAKQLFLEECFYCGRSPYNIQKLYFNDLQANYSGIDRVDSNIGYVKHNCVPCCKECNYAKRNLTQKQFFNLVNLIHQKHYGSSSNSIKNNS